MTTFAQFVDEWHPAIADAVLTKCEPIYNAAARASDRFDLSKLKRKPMMAQADAIKAAALSIANGNVLTTVVGEMGVGKTMIGASVAYLAGSRGAIILAPPHLVRKWRDELISTVPGCVAIIVKDAAGLRSLPATPAKGAPPLFVIISREHAKLGYRWHAVTAERWWRNGWGIQRDENGNLMKVQCCTSCFQPVVDDEGLPVELKELERKPRHCDQPVARWRDGEKVEEKCGMPLYTADRTGPRKWALADYIHDRMAGRFDLLIVDECHEYKGGGSAQGMAAATLAEACGRILALTGTLLGGYASTLFYLLYRFSPEVRAEFDWKGGESRWVHRYGYVERVTKAKADDGGDYGRQSKKRSKRTTIKEKPGVTPTILNTLIGTTVFVRLADVASNLPAYTEHVETVPMLGAEHRTGNNALYMGSQAQCYESMAATLKAALKDALTRGSKRLLGAYLQSLLAWADACTREERVVDPLTNDVIGYAPALDPHVIYPKEQRLIARLKSERAQGRRSCVYITHTGSRDLAARLGPILKAAGLNVAVLKRDSCPPERRMEWIDKAVKAGADVLLTNPRLVQTGLDLIDFPTLIWAEVDYSTFVLRQASRRSWRIGQKQPVHIYFMVYEDTLQADALVLIAAKLRASLMVEGEVPTEGLAAEAAGGGDEDLMVALARKLMAGSTTDARSLEAMFADTRAAEVAADSLIVSDAWASAVADTVTVVQAGVESRPLPALDGLGPITSDLLDLPMFANYGDGAVTGFVAERPARLRVARTVKVPDSLTAQLGLFDAA